jgi:excinuclease UvrABC ATPase subunit
MSEYIEVHGAREHNLKNITVLIPKKKIVCFTGISGSGKSSLVFDTIYSEAQRQLIETFSSFARRRLPKISRPDVDEIRNITTTITIDQKRMGSNPRSTVGTATEIYTYLRLLFSRLGTPVIGYDSRLFGFNNPYGMCNTCRGLGSELVINIDNLVDKSLSLNQGALKHPDFKKTGWFFRLIKMSELFDMDKPLKDFTETEINTLLYHEKRVVKQKNETIPFNINLEGAVTSLKRRYVNNEYAESRIARYPEYFQYRPCPRCNGSRINNKARSVRVNDKTIPELVEMELTEFNNYLSEIEGAIADPIIGRMKPIVKNLIDIGVGYLNLNRAVGTLSGGEAQRVKMARQLGCDLTDITYIFDEPSIGLHQRDIGKLVDMLKRINEKGNNIFVVEHDPAVIRNADFIIDLGPDAGVNGGQIVFNGTYEELLESDSITGRKLREISTTRTRRRKPRNFFSVKNASKHNLKNIDVNIPKGVFVCITGVAGSGKSTLIMDEFVPRYSDIIVIDQSPIGRTSRSNPATYSQVFTPIRKLYEEATGQLAKLFSFNSDGACPKCGGSGKLSVEMGFLENVDIKCDECNGNRYKLEVLEHRYKGKNISEVLKMTIEEALSFFDDPKITNRLKVLREVGLGYITLGQNISSLSGGEAQRIKLARELHKKGNIYVLDEPTTGLHMADIEKLLNVVDRLVESGNSVVVIEHNLDVIKNCDYIIDLGPEGGSKGGEVIATGKPEEISLNKTSYTGVYLKGVI